MNIFLRHDTYLKLYKMNPVQCICLPVNITQLDAWYTIERSGSEVFMMEIDVHVEASGAEVISSWHIRNNTFAVTPNRPAPHPHVPVPLLHRQIHRVPKDSHFVFCL